ncbi:unnamed protein product [Ambrosiozyma monospora]|uniref:Unnamed protein product n=1 Tax=Ambrosiozyma monospora TaxID=43982 RepID=A0A9W6T404_AMBMO|nr:unnamed protein product [Ambrosiozyma monospora]
MVSLSIPKRRSPASQQQEQQQTPIKKNLQDGLVRSKSKRVSSNSEDRPLKRASSISYKVDTPISFITEPVHSLSPISTPTRHQILSRKDSCNKLTRKDSCGNFTRRLRGTLPTSFRSRSISGMVKSPSAIHLSTPVSSPPHSPIATPPSVDISTDFSASRDTSFFDDVDDDINVLICFVFRFFNLQWWIQKKLVD